MASAQDCGWSRAVAQGLRAQVAHESDGSLKQTSGCEVAQPWQDSTAKRD